MRPIAGVIFLRLSKEILEGASMVTVYSFAGWMVNRDLKDDGLHVVGRTALVGWGKLERMHMRVVNMCV